MGDFANFDVREAQEGDIDGILEVFSDVYGDDYPYAGFRDPQWLKRSIFSDDILMLVAVDGPQVLGTASVVFDVGAHSDLLGEFGRLAVRKSSRGRGVGRGLMAERIACIEHRLHVGIVENRVVHPYSQRISEEHHFAPVGFLPLKHRFQSRESVGLYARHFGIALELRNNHNRIVPEVYEISHLALSNMHLPFDNIVDEDAAPYPHNDEFIGEDFTAEGLPSLMRIERGRVRNREVFGPMTLHYGFFKLKTRKATYFLARRPNSDGTPGAVVGAIGYIHDDVEYTIRIFELIGRSDQCVRFLLESLVARAQSWGVAYIEIDTSANAPRMQRTLVELGFLPAGYVPAAVFHHVERLDAVKFVRLLVPPDTGELVLVDRMQVIRDVVMEGFRRQSVGPELEQAIDRLSLFNGLTTEQSLRLAGSCSIRRLDEGHRMFEAGEDANEMFIIVAGRACVQNRQGHQLGEVGVGESVGEVAMLMRDPHSASVISCAEDTVVATLTLLDLRRLTRQRPDIGMVLYRNLAVGLGRKLRRGNRQLTGQFPTLPAGFSSVSDQSD